MQWFVEGIGVTEGSIRAPPLASLLHPKLKISLPHTEHGPHGTWTIQQGVQGIWTIQHGVQGTWTIQREVQGMWTFQHRTPWNMDYPT